MTGETQTRQWIWAFSIYQQIICENVKCENEFHKKQIIFWIFDIKKTLKNLNANSVHENKL